MGRKGHIGSNKAKINGLILIISLLEYNYTTKVDKDSLVYSDEEKKGDSQLWKDALTVEEKEENHTIIIEITGKNPATGGRKSLDLKEGVTVEILFKLVNQLGYKDKLLAFKTDETKESKKCINSDVISTLEKQNLLTSKKLPDDKSTLGLYLLTLSFPKEKEKLIDKIDYVNSSLDINLDYKNAEKLKELLSRSKSEATTKKTLWEIFPDIQNRLDFYGRKDELTELKKRILHKNYRLVLLKGLPANGKTTLAVRLAQEIQNEFDCIIGLSLVNPINFTELLARLINFLSKHLKLQNFSHGTELSKTLSEQTNRLVQDYFRQLRCLLILDNFESLLNKSRSYRQGYEDYKILLNAVAYQTHKSCLILTSREIPRQFFDLERPETQVFCQPILGLTTQDAIELFRVKGKLSFSTSLNSELPAQSIVNHYGCNPEVLFQLSKLIHNHFEGNLDNFYKFFLENQKQYRFDKAEDFFARQIERLNSEESKKILYGLAINREPLNSKDLADFLSIPFDQIIKNLEDLEAQLSLINKIQSSPAINGRKYAIIPAIVDFLTSQLIDGIYKDIDTEEINYLSRYSLLNTQASDYVIKAQIEFIIIPILEKLKDNQAEIDIKDRLKNILSELKNCPRRGGYAAGNILNILVQLNSDSKKHLEGWDFSGLPVLRAYLQKVSLQNLDFSYSDLSESVFADIIASVFSVSFSPNGQSLAAGDANGQVHIWNVETKTKETLLGGEDIGWIWSLTYIDDENLVTGSDKGEINVWNIADKGSSFLGKHNCSVRTVVWNKNNSTLASGGDDGKIILWRNQDGQWQQVQELTAHKEHPIWTVAFNHDGNKLASGGDDGKIILWRNQNGQWQQAQELTGHNRPVRAVAFSPTDDLCLASGSQDSTVRVWNLNTYKFRILEEHYNNHPREQSGDRDWIWAVAFSIGGKTLASTSENGTIKLWNVETEECRGSLKHSHAVRCIAFHPEGEILASGSYDQTVKLWEWNDYKNKGQCLKTWQGLASQVRGVAFSGDGKTLASCSGDKTVRLWNVDLSLENCKERKELKGHSNWVWSVAFSPDDPTGTTLVSSSDDTTVRVWDTNKDRCQELNHSSRVRAIAVSPNAQILACGCNDGIVWLWKRDSRNNQWEQDRQLQKHSDWIWSVAFSPDSQILASGSEDRTIWLWNVATGQPKLAQPFEAHEGMIYSVAFSPDGQILASGSGDKSVRLWDVSTGKCLKILQGHEGWIWSVAFSPKREDYLLASGSADRTIKLWDVRQIENAYCLKALPELESESEPHTNWVRTIAFSPDGQILASGSDDQKIKLWSVVTGKCFKILEAQGPYENMKITGVRNAEKNTLKALGARE